MSVTRKPHDVVVSYTLTIDPAEMSRRGRIGAYTTHSRHDARELTRAGREAFLSRFETQVDPKGELPLEERQRRAEAARKAHFARLARLSANARRARSKQATSPPEQA